MLEFEHGVDVRMIAIDGTWRRDCTMKDVADSGARLILSGSIEGLNLKEFFLLLSSTGCAYRRCELAWVDGEEVGVSLMKRSPQQSTRSGPD